jgi:hypothetical protein
MLLYMPADTESLGRDFMRLLTTVAFTLLSLGLAPLGNASPIGPNEIVIIPSGVVGSGNGTLDLRLGTFSGSEIDNASGSHNYDNGNNTLAQGGGISFAESYVTTAGEIQDYYALNFGATGPGDIQLVIFLDLNETGGGQPTNTLQVLDIILNPASIQGNPNPSLDVTSAQQAAIDQIFTGGTVIAELNPEPAANIPVNAQGAGFADYAIATGIDPFTLNPEDELLFNFSMELLNNGAEEIFLSGVFAGSDIPGVPPVVPEPGTGLLVGVGLLGLASGRRLRGSA